MCFGVKIADPIEQNSFAFLDFFVALACLFERLNHGRFREMNEAAKQRKAIGLCVGQLKLPKQPNNGLNLWVFVVVDVQKKPIERVITRTHHIA